MLQVITLALIALITTPAAFAADLSKEASAIEASNRGKDGLPVNVSATVREVPVVDVSGPNEQPVIDIIVEEPELNISEITYNLVTKDMGDVEWQKFVTGAKSRFNSWAEEYDSTNLKRFLDDRLITLAPRVTSGKGEHLKEFCKWLALYNVFVEPLPRYIRDISSEDKKWIERELSDFNWDRCAQKIKEKAK
jgi:hypothetical protein